MHVQTRSPFLGHDEETIRRNLFQLIKFNLYQVGILETKFCSSHCGRVDSQLNPFCFRSGWLGLSCSEVGSLCRSTRAGLLLHLLRIDLENFLEMGQRPVAESGKKRRMVGGCSLLARVGSTWNEQERQLQLLVRPRHLQTGIRCK